LNSSIASPDSIPPTFTPASTLFALSHQSLLAAQHYFHLQILTPILSLPSQIATAFIVPYFIFSRWDPRCHSMAVHAAVREDFLWPMISRSAKYIKFRGAQR
jgi:hypothetical protein